MEEAVLREEFNRGWRAAMGEVAAAMSTDIHMYKGELWADKIMALRAALEKAEAEREGALKKVASQREELKRQQALRALYEQYYRFAHTCRIEAKAAAEVISDRSHLYDICLRLVDIVRGQQIGIVDPQTFADLPEETTGVLTRLTADNARLREALEKAESEQGRLRDLNGALQNELDVAKHNLTEWGKRGDYWLAERAELTADKARLETFIRELRQETLSQSIQHLIDTEFPHLSPLPEPPK